MNPEREEINAALNDICGEIEAYAAKVAGIEMVFSDYWLVSIRDWVDGDEPEEKVLRWAGEKWKLQPDTLGCFLHERLMLVALHIYLYAGGSTMFKHFTIQK